MNLTETAVNERMHLLVAGVVVYGSCIAALAILSLAFFM